MHTATQNVQNFSRAEDPSHTAVIDATPQKINQKATQISALLLRIAIAIVFIWFGGLKIAGISPAYGLVEQTVFWFPGMVFVPFLGWLELTIGVGILMRPLLRIALIGMLAHMICTFLPMAIVPEICFTNHAFGLSIEGQYIVKNFVFISAALSIGIREWLQTRNEHTLEDAR